MALGLKEWPIKDKLKDFSDLEIIKRDKNAYLEKLHSDFLDQIESELRLEFEGYLKRILFKVKYLLREARQKS